MSLPELDTDVLVAGGGAAGLVTATRLALQGRRVAVLDCGISATALSSGRVLFPDAGSDELVRCLLPMIRRRWGDATVLPEPVKVTTNAGTVARQSLVTSSHDWLDGQKAAVLGIVGNPDLEPELVCATLRERGIQACVSCWTAVEGDPEAALIEVLPDLGEETVVLPPLFPGLDYARTLDRIEASTGKRLVEPLTPLSLPGKRFQALLEGLAAEAGAVLLPRRTVTAVETSGGEAVAATIASGRRTQKARFSALVLATGNTVSGGLAVVGERVEEPLGLLALSAGRGNGPASPRLAEAAATGARTRAGRGIGPDGRPYRNLFVTGSLVSGMSYPLGKGLGHVMTNAWEVAGRVEEVL